VWLFGTLDTVSLLVSPYSLPHRHTDTHLLNRLFGPWEMCTGPNHLQLSFVNMHFHVLVDELK